MWVCGIAEMEAASDRLLVRHVTIDVDERGVGQHEPVFKDVAQFTGTKTRVDEPRTTKRRPFHLNMFEGRVADVGICE